MSDAPLSERDVLEASLRESRSELQEAVGELKEAAKETLTPGEVLARRRWLWLTGAFAAGVLLARR